MSKKPSENQKPSSKFPESCFRSSNTGATSREENSLERRLFSLIRNELRRTTAQNEFATLENRIIRILRNEFVNDIMMEINTSNDEIATFFNRFIRSVPELNELGERVRSERAAREGEMDDRKRKGQGAKDEQMKRRDRHDNNGNHTFTGDLDETNLGVALEMFRAPIQVTCRACEDMRRIIRSGRRMIREIQLITALRSDLQSLRRIEMKCVEELDYIRNPRYRRHVTNIGNWRQMFRRRWRNIQPTTGRDRGSYYVVFDKLDKPRITPRILPKSNNAMIIRWGKQGKLLSCRSPPAKESLNVWNEANAKTEIARIIEMFRSFRRESLTTNLESRTSDTSFEVPVLQQISTIASQYSVVNNPGDSSPVIFLSRIEDATEIIDPIVVSPVEESDVEESSVRMDCEEAVQSETIPFAEQSSSEHDDLSSSSHEETSSLVDSTSENFPVSSIPPVTSDDAPPSFSVTLRVGSATPQDVTVFLYTDRVLVASIAQRSRSPDGGWSGWMQRRWVLPENVDAEHLLCFFREGMLVITVSSHPPGSCPFNPDFVALGPPVREAFPYPRHL